VNGEGSMVNGQWSMVTNRELLLVFFIGNPGFKVPLTIDHSPFTFDRSKFYPFLVFM